jgi:hypothetical protein
MGNKSSLETIGIYFRPCILCQSMSLPFSSKSFLSVVEKKESVENMCVQSRLVEVRAVVPSVREAWLTVASSLLFTRGVTEQHNTR